MCCSLRKFCLACLLVLIFYKPNQVECTKRSVQYDLLKHLLDEYDSPTLRPVENTEDVVLVGFRFAPLLTFLDETAQILNVRGAYLLTWQDERLDWNPANYSGIKEINLPLFKDGVGEKNIWKPELIIYESVGARRVSFQPETHSVKVTHSGDVFWYTLSTTTSDCTVRVRYYPFDNQICHLRFTTWLYPSNEQLFYEIDDIIETKAYKNYEIKSEVWDVVVEDVKVENATYECISCEGEEQSFVHYTLKLSRNNRYMYVINLMLPCIVMSGMTLLVIWLPKNDVAAAASFGVTCILTFNVFLTYLMGLLPSTGLPLIGEYMVWLIVEAVIITLFGVHRATMERKRAKRLLANPEISDGKVGEAISSGRKSSSTSSAKSKVNEECGNSSSEEDVDVGHWSVPSMKLTRLGKDGDYNRVESNIEEKPSTEHKKSTSQIPEHEKGFEISKDDKELRLRASASLKEAPDSSEIETYSRQKNLFSSFTSPPAIRSNFKLKHAIMCLKAITSMVFVVIFLIFVFS